MLWIDFYLNRDADVRDVIHALAKSFSLDTDDFAIIESTEQISEISKSLIASYFSESDVSNKALVDIYLFNGLKGHLSNLVQAAKMVGTEIVISDDDAGNNHYAFLQISGGGSVRRVLADAQELDEQGIFRIKSYGEFLVERP